MQTSLDELRNAVVKAEADHETSRRRYAEATKAYATAYAESMGVHIGSVVRVTKQIGYGSKRKTVTSRYTVSRIDYRSYGKVPIRLHGTTIRKGGSTGDRHEIYNEWELEKPEVVRP